MNWTVLSEGRELTVTLQQSADQLQGLRHAWRELVSSSSSDSAFLSWEWISSWSEQFIKRGRQLFLLVVSDRSQIIGIAPWYLDSSQGSLVASREIRFLGGPESGADYLDVIVRKRREQQVANAIMTVLWGDVGGAWDVLALKDVPSDSAFLARLMSGLRWAGKHYTIEEGAFCPVVHLPSSFEEYLGQLSGHCRRAYRRKMRRLMSAARVEHVVLRTDRLLSVGLPAFRAIHEKRWGEPMNGLFDLVHGYAGRADLSSAWSAELSLLEADGRAVAALVHLTNGRRKCQYLMAVDRTFNSRLSVGTLICGMNIQAAIEAGYTEYDFLKGDEPYKRRLTNSARRAMNITVHNRTVGAMSAWSVRTAKDLGKLLVR